MQPSDARKDPTLGDLQRELDLLAAAVGHSVSLDAPHGTLLGYSSQGTDVDIVRVNAILTRRVPDDALAYQGGCGIETAAAPIRVPANRELAMAARTLPADPPRTPHRRLPMDA